MVSELCKAGANPDLARRGGLTPTFLAASMGHPQCLEVLLKHGANPNGATTVRGLTGLHVAAQLDHVEVIHVLARYEADREAQNTEKMRPAYMAAVHNSHAALEALISYGVDVEAQNKSGETPLFGACLLGHTEAVRSLIHAKASLRPPGGNITCEPLYAAAQNGHLGCVEAILAQAAPAGGESPFTIDTHSEDFPTAVYVAAQRGHHEVVAALCRAKAHPHRSDTRHLTPKGGGSPRVLGAGEYGNPLGRRLHGGTRGCD